MSWFRVDDGFHSHPKTLEVSLAARGLWVTAGSWSGHHLTDGFVPRAALSMWQADDSLAAELVASGLWVERDGGWAFHDWHDQNPSRKSVISDRKAGAERARKSRARHTVTEAHAPGPRAVSVHRPDPSRPDPSQGENAAPSAAAGPLPPKLAGLYAEARARKSPVPYEHFNRDREAWDIVARAVTAYAASRGIDPPAVGARVVERYLAIGGKPKAEAWPPKWLADRIDGLLQKLDAPASAEDW